VLIVQQAACCWIAQHSVREQQLLWRGCAGIVFLNLRPVTEDGDLHAERA
jgi:hypothetical protein